MSAANKRRIISDLESQGAKVRETKKGLMIYAPDGAMRSIHTVTGERTGLMADINWFRKHGLSHPADHTPKEADVKKAETNEEGYPLYVASPINSTTRKRVLAELESKGWPLKVRPTDLAMDTVTATRALYNVGYRWDPESPEKRREWMAPDDIREMHEKVKAEMARREQEAKEARAAQHHAVKTDSVLALVAAARAKPLPSLDFVKPVSHDGPHHPTLNPTVHMPTPKDVAEAIDKGEGDKVPVPFVERTERKDDYALASFPEAERVPPVPDEIKEEREFIDSVDSWVIDDTDLPPLMTVSDLRWVMEASGIEVEVRVWRKQ